MALTARAHLGWLRLFALGVAAVWAMPPRALGQAASELGAPVGGSGGQPDAAAATPPEVSREQDRLAVFEPQLVGVDPVIGPHVVEQLRRSALARGYALTAPASIEAAAQGLGYALPERPAELWHVLHRTASEAGLFVRVWAEQGRYAVELTVALLDGRGPFVERRYTDHTAFLTTLDAMVESLLPPPGTGASATQPTPIAPPPGAVEAAFEPERDDGPELDEGPPPRRLGLALTSGSAFGLGGNAFYNHLLGARVDVRLNHEIVLGAYLGYANLAGYQGRVGNLMTYAQIEDRVRVSDHSSIRVPLRFGAGFVPRNGAVIRMAAGIAWPSSERLEWGLDLLAPMIWILPEGGVATSLNLAVEMIFSP